MIFKRFSVVISILVALMGVSMFLFFWSIEVSYLKFSVYGFAFITLLLLYIIIREVIRNNYKINRFLENYIVNEGSPKFSNSYSDPSFKSIEDNLNRISKLYGEVKTDKEAEHVFLQHLIDELNVGVLVYDETGKISLKNRFFSHVFGVHSFQNIKVLKAEKTEVYNLLNEAVGKSPTILRLVKDQQRLLISVSISKFSMKNENYNLALFQDVTNEIGQEEVESWQKLIKILRHEIINSLTPITTLSSTLIDNLDEVDYKKAFAGNHFKTIETNYKGLKAIEKRSEGLMEFIKGYKELSSTLKPKLKEVQVQPFFEQLQGLVGLELEKKNIEFIIEYMSKPQPLFIDEKQIMQVMLNLVKNAVEALVKTSNPQISILYNNSINKNTIEVVDNGPGISMEEQEKIFIPFYSTKKQGSGIGLSLCKQILHLHKGSIYVKSRKGKTLIRLEF